MGENLLWKFSTNWKVEPLAPYVMRAQMDTFVEEVRAKEGQTVKKGEEIRELEVKDAEAKHSEAKGNLMLEQDGLRAATAGGKRDDGARVPGGLKEDETNSSR